MSTHGKRAVGRSQPSKIPPIRFVASQVVMRPTASLKPYPGNARRHPEAQLRALMRNISEHGWTSPMLIDENNTILAGHGRLEAAKRLGLSEVPTLILTGLSDAKKRAIVISDNRLAEKAVWDFDALRGELRELVAIDFDVELTGFSTGEVDILLDGPDSNTEDPADDLGDTELQGPTVTRPGDVWTLGNHRLLCGDARDPQSYEQLLGEERAEMVVTDPPYNVAITGHVRGRGKIRHREFAMASGEMSEPEYSAFLEAVIQHAIAFSDDGSIHYWFIDWRHLPTLHRAAMAHYFSWMNLLIWKKSNAGQGSFYRSQHELIGVFKAGTSPHINNFELGAQGRYRTNVLDYPGGANPTAKRQRELEMHPTVKPVALVADLVRDCSRRNGIILDAFAGSGTVFLAAERTGRAARGIEIDPAYVDLAISRWEQMTGRRACHGETGLTFEEVRCERVAQPTAGDASHSSAASPKGSCR